MTTPVPDHSPERLLANVRLHHVLNALVSVRYPDYRHVLKVDGEGGLYLYDNGEGDVLAVRWRGRDLVAIGYSHESERGEREPAPFRELPWLRALPAEHVRAVEELLAAVPHPLIPTAAMWTESGALVTGEALADADAQGLFLFERYALEPKEALNGRRGQNWAELASVPRDLAKLALSLATGEKAALSKKDLERLAKFVQPRAQIVERVRRSLALLEPFGVRAEPGVDLESFAEPRQKVVLAAFRQHRRGEEIATPELATTGLRVFHLEPTRFARTDWPRVIALSILPTAGRPEELQARLLAADGSPLDAKTDLKTELLSNDGRLMVTLVAAAPVPQDASLELSFLCG